MNKFWMEVLFVFISSIVLYSLVSSLTRDLRPSSTISQEGRALVSAAASKLNTAPGQRLTLEDYSQFMMQHPDFVWRPLLSQQKDIRPEQEDQLVRHALLESAVSELNKRVDRIENDRLGVAAIFKAILIWLLSTFLAPVVGDLGRRSFGIREKVAL